MSIWDSQLDSKHPKNKENRKREQINKEAFETLEDEQKDKIRGFLPGKYVRIVLEKVPKQFFDYFDSKKPVVLGGCLPKEQNLSFVQVKLQKHRWHKKVLKTNDPLIVSMGWHRFQTLPVFSTKDANGRNRMLKYTPEQSHCFASFWGPLVPQGTGVFGFTALEAEENRFQVAVTGVVTETSSDFNIVKKLKLVGEAVKIEKNTAFVKGMFNSVLEAAKFEGGAIRTVSGIRGSVKKALTNSSPGAFRATFEDKILLSDLVFMRCWAPVKIEKFYNPLRLKLEPSENLAKRKISQSIEKQETKSGNQNLPIMKLSNMIRKERNLANKQNPDSEYRTIERVEKVFAPLKIPTSLQKNLPFKSKPKLEKKEKLTFEQKRPKVGRRETRAIDRLINDLGTIKNVALSKEKKKREERSRKLQNEQKKLNEKILAKDRERRILHYVFGKKK